VEECSNNMLRTEGITKTFEGLKAVDDVSIELPEGVVTAIIGPNGAGKTTLINLISGLLEPDSGRIFLEGEDLTDKPPDGRVSKGISRTFQVTNIFQNFTVYENLKVPVLSLDEEEPGRRIDEMLDWFGLEDLRDTRASNLSHGDVRVLEIAMAVSTDPSVLLLDEPTAGMSTEEKGKATDVIEELKDERDIVLVIVEHSMDVIFSLADQIKVLNEGRIIREGKPAEISEDEEVIDAYLGGAYDVDDA